MNKISSFWARKFKNCLGRWHSPLSRLLPIGEDIPSPNPTPSPAPRPCYIKWQVFFAVFASCGRLCSSNDVCSQTPGGPCRNQSRIHGWMALTLTKILFRICLYCL